MIKDFYVDSWQAQSPGLNEGLSNRMQALNQLSQGLQNLVSTNQIQGEGADRMKAYISEVHLSLIKSLQVAIQTYQTAVGVYSSGYKEIDSSGNFRLVKEDFDEHIRQLDRGIQDMDNFQHQFRDVSNSVGHLVSLGSFQAVERVKNDFEDMRRIVRDQREAWSSYENHDPGFN